MNKQDMFDVMTTALLAQGKKSGEKPEEGDFECLYRAPDGCKCAIGHLIKDKFYTPDMEGANIRSDLPWEALKKSIGRTDLSDHDRDFLEHMQEIHDETAPETWDAQFRKVAIEWALEYKGEQF